MGITNNAHSHAVEDPNGISVRSLKGVSVDILTFPKVLINDYAGHPFQIDLSRELASRGRDVTHAYCSTNVTPKGDLEDGDSNLHIVGISTGKGFEKYNVRKRFVAEIRYGLSSARLLVKTRPDICINSNVPVISLAIVSATAKLMRIPSTLWLQDFQAGLVAMALGSDRHLIARMVSWVENWCIRSVDHVVTISKGFENETKSVGQKPERITTIPNWAPIDDLPLIDRKNSWAERHDLTDRLVYLYSGTLGLKHRPESLIELCHRLGSIDPEAVVVLISESVGAEWIESQRTADEPLSNLMILPFQPFDELPSVLASADVLVSLLEPDAGEFSVPSKVLTYLCAGRAVLGLMPSDNAATRLVVDEARAGLVADNCDEFLAHAERLAIDSAFRADCGLSARSYAESTFPVDGITDRFEEVFQFAVDGGRPRSPESVSDTAVLNLTDRVDEASETDQIAA